MNAESTFCDVWFFAVDGASFYILSGALAFTTIVVVFLALFVFKMEKTNNCQWPGTVTSTFSICLCQPNMTFKSFIFFTTRVSSNIQSLHNKHRGTFYLFDMSLNCQITFLDVVKEFLRDLYCDLLLIFVFRVKMQTTFIMLH